MKMMKFALLLALPSVVFSGSASNIRGSHTEREDVAKAHRNLAVTLPPSTSDPFPASLSAGAIRASSHVVQWGSSKTAGCSYTLPQITIACGTGATISLGQKTSTVKGCVYRNGNTLVCAALPTATSNPQVFVTCFGTTAAQLAASIQVPPSQATCSAALSIFPQNKLIFRGGSASVFALLGRYCKNNTGTTYINYNYTCGGGDNTVNQGGLRFCVTGRSCSTRLFCNSTNPEQSCPGSCVEKMGAVTISDADSRSECSNVGPRPSTLPAGLHSASWSSSHPTCRSEASNTITTSCGPGGFVNILSANSGVSQCNPIGSASLRCSRTANASSATIVFYCYGRNATARTASIFLPKNNFSDCNTGAASTTNVASQALVLKRYCGNTTYVSRPFKGCANSAQREGDSCIAKNTCKSTSKSSCSIGLDAVAMADNTNDPTCTVIGPKSVNF